MSQERIAWLDVTEVTPAILTLPEGYDITTGEPANHDSDVHSIVPSELAVVLDTLDRAFILTGTRADLHQLARRILDHTALEHRVVSSGTFPGRGR